MVGVEDTVGRGVGGTGGGGESSVANECTLKYFEFEQSSNMIFQI